LVVQVPTLTGSAMLLDAGATLDCRPHHLRTFGIMGSAYASIVLGLDRPRVGVLSVGEEAGKGTDLIREAHALLSAAPVNFVGNVEARDVFSGQVDVIVCDGFVGNITLKVGEGLVDTLGRLLAAEVRQSWASAVGARLTKGAFGRLRKRVDPVEHGGAPLLGINGLALVGHGRSNERAVRNGIAAAARLFEGQLVSRMREALRVSSDDSLRSRVNVW
jgi:glycerol-3-phosphate acyltransferase PlsX